MSQCVFFGIPVQSSPRRPYAWSNVQAERLHENARRAVGRWKISDIISCARHFIPHGPLQRKLERWLLRPPLITSQQ
jgi:hypothetical protein